MSDFEFHLSDEDYEKFKDIFIEHNAVYSVTALIEAGDIKMRLRDILVEPAYNDDGDLMYLSLTKEGIESLMRQVEDDGRSD